MTTSRLLRTAALAALPTLAAAHAAPAISTFGPLRNRAMPRLAGRGRRDHVALTFDDGPDPLSTPRFLGLLAARRIRATFFLLGREAQRSPDLVRDIAAAGHEIGIHGWLHRPLLLRGLRATYDDFARARDIVADITGHQPILFRPPYGVMSTAAHIAARRLSLTPVLWTCWERTGPHAPHRSPSTRESRPTWMAAAPSCSTTPTARPPRAPGGRPWARSRASSTPVSNAASRSVGCATTDGRCRPDLSSSMISCYSHVRHQVALGASSSPSPVVGTCQLRPAHT